MSNEKHEIHYIRKHLWQRLTEAIKTFGLIAEGDRIGVGLSGGMDSSLLLFALSSLVRRAPVSFEVVGLHVDCGFGTDVEPLKALCTRTGAEFHVTQAPIAKALRESREKTSPCSLCANLRRGALNTLAKSLNCNKVALGHHADDALETLLLCMMYESRIATLKPTMYLNRSDITVIRPLLLVRKEAIVRSIEYYDLPWARNKCPYEHKTKRSLVRAFLDHLETLEPGAKARLIASLKNVDVGNLWV